MPENTVYVGRGTIFGNPFKVTYFRSYEEAVALYTGLLLGKFDKLKLKFPTDCKKKILANLHKLKGKNLACWCPLDKPCHADVLIEMANSNDPGRR